MPSTAHRYARVASAGLVVLLLTATRQIPAGKFWNTWTSSLVSTPLTPTDFFNGFRHTLRRAYQLAQAETAEAESPSSAADSGESASTTSNSSDSYESGETVTVKDSPELIKE